MKLKVKMMTSKIDKITQDIKDLIEDIHMDGYHQGTDESWDEARDKGYDEGWDDCKVHMDKQEAYDKTSAYDNGYKDGSNETYDLMKTNEETAYNEGWLAATEGHTEAKQASWEEGYLQGGAEWKHSCPRDDAGDKICSYAPRAAYDEGFDTAMTNFEADERITAMTDEAYGNGYTCGIRNGITELLNRLELMAAADDNNLINIYRIHEAGLEVFKDHPLMKDKK